MSTPLNGIGPAGKSPKDYLTERANITEANAAWGAAITDGSGVLGTADLRRVAMASRAVEVQRERCIGPTCKLDRLWIDGDVWAEPDPEGYNDEE